MTNTEVMILCIALLGVVLGVVNLWYSLQSHRVRLRVVPKLAFDIEGGRYTTSEWNEYARRRQESGAAKRWMIEVVNLSTFALTIDEVGFGDHSEAGNYAMMDPEISRGKTHPVRLEPHEKGIFYSTDGVLLPERVWTNPFAYAKTDCGSSFYGQSPVLLEIAKDRSLVS